MRHNNYDGLLEQWKVRLMASRAKRLGFRPDQIEDAQQELVLDVLAFRFDPLRSNGATEATALTALIDKRLRAIQRASRRYRNRLTGLKAQLGVDEARDRWPHPVEDMTELLVMDVREAVSRLPSPQRRLCKALIREGSLARVARRDRCGWHTVGRSVEGLRRRLAGLKGWVIR